MGSEEFDVPVQAISVGDLFHLMLSKRPAREDHGFSKYNTLLVINDGEAFSASAQQDRILTDGDSVLFVPFSHGG